MPKHPLAARWPAALLAALIALGLAAHFLELFEWREALARFLAAAALGLGVKAYLYSSVILSKVPRVTSAG